MGKSIPKNNNNLPETKNGISKYIPHIILAALILLCISSLFIIPNMVGNVIRKNFDSAINPIEQTGEKIKDQVNEIVHPTPTVYVDAASVIHEMRSLSRLETIQYSIEKVITAESSNDEFGFLFGDQLLFIAHGTVIAGIDLNKDIQIDIKGEDVYVTLPQPEVFIATLDNEKSYVYDRQVGILTKGDPNLETSARRAAEEAILNAALEDGILNNAQKNAESFLLPLLNGFGFDNVHFRYQIKMQEEIK